MRKPSNFLDELIRVRSDTGTLMEQNIAKTIYDIIASDAYFQEHPELFGAYDAGDRFNRPVVWALKRGKGEKTIILSGHYDAVDIECYGTLRPYALDPPSLLKEMLKSPMVKDEIKTELSSGKWMVGRGSADMKSGIAISLYMLLYFDLPDELNLLFTAVSDEENLSAGAIQAVDLYKELKEIFGLDYKLAIVTEPDSYKKVDGPFNVMHGSSGKMLPVVVAKGCLCHSANILNGLNPTLIISEVIRRLELSADFQSPSYGVAPQPPTTLFIFDSKKTYDVSIPEYCAAGFNVMSLYPADPAEYIDKLLAVCEEAAASAIEKYSATYDSVERTGVLAGPKMDFKPEVLTVENLREKLKEKYADFDSRLELIEKNVMLEFEKKNFPMHKAGILYIESLIELAQTAQPIIVLGFVPPYYPSISNYFLSKETLEMIDGIISELNDEGVVKAKNGAFIPGPTDLSYFACLNLHANQKILASLCVPKAAYNIDFESLSRLQIPSIQIGAAGLNVHEACERVYLPDLDEKVPYIIGKILRSF